MTNPVLIVIIAVASGVFGALLVRWFSQTGKVIARAFLLVDEKGYVRGALDFAQGVPGLAFYDDHQEGRILLRFSEGNPLLSFCDAQGQPEFLLTATGRGGSLNMYDSDGSWTVLDGHAFSVKDAAGSPRAGLGQVPGGTMLYFWDAEAKAGADVGLLQDGLPGVGLRDATGRVRLGLRIVPGGGPFITLHDATGQVRACMAVRPEGEPAVMLCDAHGDVLWHAP